MVGPKCEDKVEKIEVDEMVAPKSVDIIKEKKVDEMVPPKCVDMTEEKKVDEMENAEKEQHIKSLLQTYQDPSTSLAVNTLQVHQ